VQTSLTALVACADAGWSCRGDLSDLQGGKIGPAKKVLPAREVFLDKDVLVEGDA
jgi:hypothetical protein